MEVSAAELARMCGVSRAAVSGKKASGTLVFNSAGKIDTDNPVNRAYIDRHQAKMKSQLEMKAIEAAIARGEGSAMPEADSGAKTTERCNASFAGAPQSGNGQEKKAASAGNFSNAGTNPVTTASTANEMLNMTVRQLIMRHGSIDNVEKYSKILRDLSAADEREQKMQERRLAQVPKDFVVQRLFEYVDQLMNQLLDVPESVCDQIIAVSLAGGNDVRVSVIHILSDNLTKCISGAKEHIVGELNALRNKYDKRENAVSAIAEQVEEMREVG